jgi:pimeloyl-ACP methyl ester carboxylesterase
MSRAARAPIVAAAALAGLAALANHFAARRAERKHPPDGSFIEVDGIRLHYSDRGEGSPVVLIHGNAVSGNDYNTSGVADLLIERHRVIIFDRPGFGFSERPRGVLWTAHQQAELLHKALKQLGIERPVVVGHSWGALVALELAAHHQSDTAGLVLLSGYYFWTLRPDVLLVALGAVPVLGDLLRYTISPLLGRLMIPLFKRAIFSPAPVPARFQDEYSAAMALRPSQIRATSVDATLMIPGALSLRDYYKNLAVPVIIMAGEGDKIVFKRSARLLHAIIPGSVLHIIGGAGHMIHHLAAGKVAESIGALAEQAHNASEPGPTRKAA